MRNVLVLLTNQFPYNTETGEMYLNIEIQQLACVFDKVIVCPTDVQKVNDVYLYRENVNVITKQTRKRKVNKLANMIKSVCCYVTCAYKNLDNCLQEEYIHLDSYKQKLFFYYFFSRAKQKFDLYVHDLKNEIETSDYVCIYSYRLFDTASMALMLKQCLKAKKILLVSRTHGYDLYSSANKLNYLPQRQYLYKNIDYIFPCSFDGKEYLINEGCEPNKVLCLYLGSKATKFKNNCSTGRFEILSLSTNSPVKRLSLIAKTIKELSKRCNIIWTHIGGGAEKIIAENKKYVDSGVMRFLGEKDHDEAMNIICKNNIDLFINLSSSEGLPQSIMEAYSFGIPCIATDVGGTREIVDDRNGFLIPAGMEARDIADIIYKYIQYSKTTKMNYKMSAYNKWKMLFNADKNAFEFTSIIKNFLKA